MNIQSTNDPNSHADPHHDRDLIARFNTQLGLDRTTLAWVRTALTMATFGFGMVGFFRTLQEKTDNAKTIQLHEDAIHFGVALLSLGIAATIFAGISHWRTLRRLRRGDALVMTAWPLSITVAALVAVMGLVGLWSLFSR